MNVVRALILVTFSLSLCVAAGSARAQITEIYKCADKSGRPLYTSDRKDTAGKKCELVSRAVNVVPAQKGGSARQGFPKESADARASARERQREILERELAAEQTLLAKAQQELAEQEATRSGNEQNYAKVLERLQPYKDNVDLHTKNVEALRRELLNQSR